jgi:hypothetical protein
VLIGPADIGRNDLQDHAMLDLAALRIFELGIGDILNLDFARLGVDDTTISAHDKPLCAEGLPAASGRSAAPSRSVIARLPQRVPHRLGRDETVAKHKGVDTVITVVT